MFLKQNSSQEWFYFSNQSRDDLTIFECWDSSSKSYQGETEQFWKDERGWRVRIIKSMITFPYRLTKVRIKRLTVAPNSFRGPLHHPIHRCPLAFCSASSISLDQFVPCDIVSKGYVGESTFLKYSAEHQWYWFKDQQLDEALWFTSFDTHPQIEGLPCEHFRNFLLVELTMTDRLVAVCFHSSCKLDEQHLAKEAPFRESTEVRVLVITALQSI